MNNIHDNGIEKALAMYTETVSPSKDTLVYVLNQIPEIKELKASDRRAIRSPYRWLYVAQLVSIMLVVVAVYPHTIQQSKLVPTDNPFYEIDAQVEQFEQRMENEDYKMMVEDYTL